jgi:hypothetical protein
MLSYVSEQSTVDFQMEFHMTIRLKVSNLTPKQASMLLSVCNVKAVAFGVDLTLYLAIEYLQNWCRKTGTDLLYVNNEKIRQTLLISELILTAIRGTWLTLRDYEQLPDDVREKIIHSGFLPDKRTIDSWKQHWELEKYLQVKIVPVENLIERQPSTYERYSGYIRGYGQDGNPPAPHKTKDEPVDGEISQELPKILLQDFETYLDILNSIEIYKARKKQK